MPDSTPRAPARPPAGEERVFVDDAGRLWNAALARRSESAVLFSCISESRTAVRAIAAEHALHEFAANPRGDAAGGATAGGATTGGATTGGTAAGGSGSAAATRLLSLTAVSDDTLRAWLSIAPPVSLLT